MDNARETIKNVARIAFRLRARGAMSALRNRGGVAIMIGEALRESLSGKLSPGEKGWIVKIEQLRRSLCASRLVAPIRDFGARRSLRETYDRNDAGCRVVLRSIGDICRDASKSPFWCLMLLKLVEKLRPATCIELGTSLGISACYQAAALEMQGNGTLVTLEGADSLATFARENLQRVGLKNVHVAVGRFQDILGGVLETSQKVDFAFVDGHHEENATLAYFSQMLPYLSAGAVVVFDDISWSDGMRRAWQAIVQNEKACLSIYLRQMGLCVICDGGREKMKIRMPLV